MGNAWPVVCMTALAISCDRTLRRTRISAQTAARTSAPASRQAGIAAAIAGISASTSATGYVISSSSPNGERSSPAQVAVAGCSIGNGLPRYASNAAAPASADSAG